MAEPWFSALSRGLLRRGEFTSRDDLAAKITDFAIRCNRTARPYSRTYGAAPTTPAISPATPGTATSRPPGPPKQAASPMAA